MEDIKITCTFNEEGPTFQEIIEEILFENIEVFERGWLFKMRFNIIYVINSFVREGYFEYL